MLSLVHFSDLVTMCIAFNKLKASSDRLVNVVTIAQKVMAINMAYLPQYTYPLCTHQCSYLQQICFGLQANNKTEKKS